MNDCLVKGRPLQKKLCGVLVRSRFHLVIFCADTEKAFLQFRIRQSKRDFLRFYLVGAANNDEIEIYRFATTIHKIFETNFSFDVKHFSAVFC